MQIEENSFFNKITEALKDKQPFTAYNNPNSLEVKGYFQKSNDLYYSKNFTDSGFIFAPFDDDNRSILFPLSESETYTTVINDISLSNAKSKYEFILKSKNKRNTHLELVKKGIQYLEVTGTKKVVLSRKEEIYFEHFNVLETFKKLLINYTNAMVYLWYHPKIGLWLGATPETLLKVDNNTFSTMALAGTQLYSGSLDVFWPNKEKQEQQFVTDFLINELSNTSIIIDVSKPLTVKAGNLVHLCTKIEGRLSEQFSLYELIKLLHPTPAVCGLPKAEAKLFILENEGYDREFYTGFFGELNVNKTSSLYVNLRCMQVLKNQLTLYIGGGITIDSNPEKEWEETLAKSEVMFRVLA